MGKPFFSQEYLLYFKEKDPLFGRIDGFQIDPSRLYVRMILLNSERFRSQTIIYRFISLLRLPCFFVFLRRSKIFARYTIIVRNTEKSSSGNRKFASFHLLKNFQNAV